jgi:D-3-phosphoglycerate dehydrogenase
MFTIQTLNNISPVGLARLPQERFTTGADLTDPDAILLRSADLHSTTFGPSLKAVGRAGAGVNNIPVAALTARGIPVFNAPGANANAVKELVIAGLILACRQIVPAMEFVRTLGDGGAAAVPDKAALDKAVEAGKKAFAGYELPGRTLAVVGLGAIGGRVANTAVALGMQVVGYDPGLTLDSAWQLSAAVQRARSLDEALRTADFVSLHVPLNTSTRHLIDADRLKAMKRRVAILNFAREGIVDEAAMLASLDAGHAHAYISDFPTPGTIRHPKCVTLPHLGASTAEAEDNCAVMVADQVRDFLEHGHVHHAVNFPEIAVPRQAAHRCVCVCAASDQANARVAAALAEAGVSVAGLAGATRGDVSVVVVDTAAELPEAVHTRLGLLEGLLSMRVLLV